MRRVTVSHMTVLWQWGVRKAFRYTMEQKRT